MLKQYLDETKVEVGLDEAGRGCLFGPLCVAAVVWPTKELVHKSIHLPEIKDSKKISEKKRLLLKDFIEGNAVAYSVKFISHNEIDTLNILQATMKGMHQCIDDIRQQLEIDTILVDGNRFDIYTDDDLNCINHECVINGDNTYKSIAAASILAKTYRDNYIYDLVKQNPELDNYGFSKNKGYGTKIHMNAIKKYGPINGHRLSFKPCKLNYKFV
jgi:ribonuclease HII